jgi:hypothetical protein
MQEPGKMARIKYRQKYVREIWNVVTLERMTNEIKDMQEALYTTSPNMD